MAFNYPALLPLAVFVGPIPANAVPVSFADAVALYWKLDYFRADLSWEGGIGPVFISRDNEVGGLGPAVYSFLDTAGNLLELTGEFKADRTLLVANNQLTGRRFAANPGPIVDDSYLILDFYFDGAQYWVSLNADDTPCFRLQVDDGMIEVSVSLVEQPGYILSGLIPNTAIPIYYLVSDTSPTTINLGVGFNAVYLP